MKKRIFVNKDDLKKSKNKIKKIFFYRICGTGMGAAAALLKEKGFKVEGGDIDFYPPMSTYLESIDIPLVKISNCTADYLNDFDLIIVGNVVPGISNDATLIESLNTMVTSFPEALGGLLLGDKQVVGVSGTHGKTTTTHLGVQVFQNLGVDVGYFIGGVLLDGPSARMSEGNLFFIEADEYDTAYFQKTSKFLHYNIRHLIVTSLEYDHADIFENEEQIISSFSRLLNSEISSKIINTDYPMGEQLLSHDGDEVTYGFNRSECGPKILSKNLDGVRFELTYDNEKYQFKTNIKADHNILNLSAIILLALRLGHKKNDIDHAIKNLKLVKRRQEHVGTINNANLYDDFAHHPTAVLSTIRTFLELNPEKKLVVIFEPASSTARSDLFQHRFFEALENAHEVIIIPPTRKTTAINRNDLNIDLLKDNLEASGTSTFLARNIESLEEILLSRVDSRSVVLTMSNGKVLNLFRSGIIKK